MICNNKKNSYCTHIYYAYVFFILFLYAVLCKGKCAIETLTFKFFFLFMNET